MKNFFLIFAFLIIISCENESTSINNNIKKSKYILIDAQGNPIPLPKDKLIVVNFMAYSCGACISEIPKMKDVISKERFKDKFQIIALVIDSKKGDFSDPLFPIYANNNINFVKFPVPGTPTTYIITPEGKKLITIYGAVTEKTFRKFLIEALKKYHSAKKTEE